MQEYIPARYKQAEVLILPEMGKEVAQAGFPGNTAEYMSVGKPIITTDFSNIKDVLQHEYNCLMSPLGDDAGYQKNITALLDDETLRFRLGKNAVESAVKTFDYRESTKTMIEDACWTH